MGWRDYDPETGRFTALDPIGYAGGDSDLYGYCVDDPVNNADQLGLFRFGKRPLGILPETWHEISKDGSLADLHNFEPKHEHGFYEDGSGDNIGFGKDGLMTEEDISKYQLDDTHYDDKRMRRAQRSTTTGVYCLSGNNCQDYADRLRQRYGLLERGDKMR
jgi:uncharacterized protein RhaS with RHS repeats